MSRSVYATLRTLAALLLCLSPAAAVMPLPPTPSSGPGLFSLAPDVPGREASEGLAVTRGRPVRVAFEALRAARPGTSVRLNLFDDADYTGLIERARPHAPDSVSLSGRILNSEGGAFYLVAHRGALAGYITTRDGRVFRVVTLAEATHAVQQVDPAALPPCGSGPSETLPPDAVPTAGEMPSGADAGPSGADVTVATDGEMEAAGYVQGPVIDVMVVYTPAAETAAGGTAAIEAKAQLSIDMANAAYENSGVAASLMLVRVARVDYTEAAASKSNFSLMLSQLTNLADEAMDDVHIWRNECGADIVSLLVKDGTYCGLGWVMTGLSTGFSTYGFNVVNHGCASSGPTMAHEIGHNQGCHHDRENATSSTGTLQNGLYPYSYGWRYNGNSGVQFRTVMAYSPGTRLLHFSSPDVLYDGQPTGVPVGEALQSNNARGISESAATVAAFKPSSAVASPVAVGWTLASEDGAQANGAIDPGETVTVEFALANRASRNGNSVWAEVVPSSGVAPITTMQTYGWLISGGAPVSQPFQMVLDGACGDVVPVSLRVYSNSRELGTVTFPVRLGRPAAVSREVYAAGVPAAIATRSTLEQTVTVPYTGMVGDVNVHVRLDHGYDYYLTMTLVGPDGTAVELSSQNGSSGDNFGSGPNACDGVFTVFDDEADIDVKVARAPFAGAFRPEQPLSAFRHKPIRGDWTLRIENTSSYTSGMLGCWNLEFAREPYACGVAPTLADAAMAMRVAAGMEAPEDGTLSRLDVCATGSSANGVDVMDALFIARMVLGVN